MRFGEVSEPAFDFYVEVLQCEDFRRMEGSWYWLKSMQGNWEYLSGTQKQRLLEVLEEVYPGLEDWMGCFVISELLGSYFGDRRALEVLRRLRITAPDTARALLPHGFEHLIEESQDRQLVETALLELNAMRDDPASLVREETEQAVARLARRRGGAGHQQ